MTKPKEDDENEPDELRKDFAKANTDRIRTPSISSKQSMGSSVSVRSVKGETEASEKTQHEESELLQQLEASSKGKIKGSLLAHYLKSANRPFMLCFLIIAFLLSQILASSADIFVSYW